MFHYRVWIYYGGEREEYRRFHNIKELALYLIDHETDKKWGIEKFDSTQNIWVDAFYSDDMVSLFRELVGYIF